MMHSSSSVGETRRRNSDNSWGLSDNNISDFGQLSAPPVNPSGIGAPSEKAAHSVWSELSFEPAASTNLVEGMQEEVKGKDVARKEADESGADVTIDEHPSPHGDGYDDDDICRCISKLAFALEGSEKSKGGRSSLMRKESSVHSETLCFGPEDEQSVHTPLFSREPSSIGVDFLSAETTRIGTINEEGNPLNLEHEQDLLRIDIGEEDTLTRDVPQIDTVHQPSAGSAAIDEIQQDLSKVNAALHETWSKTRDLVQPIVKVAAAGAHAVVPQRFSGDDMTVSLDVTSLSRLEHDNHDTPQMQSLESTSSSNTANDVALELADEAIDSGREREGELSDALLSARRILPSRTDERNPQKAAESAANATSRPRSLRSAEPLVAMSQSLSQSVMGIGSQMHSQVARLRERSAHLVEDVQKEETIRKAIAKGADLALSVGPRMSSLAESGGTVAKDVVHTVEDLVEDLQKEGDEECDDPELLSQLTAGAYA